MHTFAAAKGKTLQVWYVRPLLSFAFERFECCTWFHREGFKSNVPGETPGDVAPSTVAIPQDVVVQPFDCNIYVPPSLAKDGYKMINSAWTPLCECVVLLAVGCARLCCSLCDTRASGSIAQISRGTDVMGLITLCRPSWSTAGTRGSSALSSTRLSGESIKCDA